MRVIHQLVSHVDMHDNALAPQQGEQEYGQLYDEAYTVWYGVKMYDVIAPQYEKSREA